MSPLPTAFTVQAQEPLFSLRGSCGPASPPCVTVQASVSHRKLGIAQEDNTAGTVQGGPEDSPAHPLPVSQQGPGGKGRSPVPQFPRAWGGKEGLHGERHPQSLLLMLRRNGAPKARRRHFPGVLCRTGPPAQGCLKELEPGAAHPCLTWVCYT